LPGLFVLTSLLFNFIFCIESNAELKVGIAKAEKDWVEIQKIKKNYRKLIELV
ncbi:hypothetical protein LCGC14_3152060, partial [marine sediment metagenome]